jgi:hypothetical protein
MTDLSVDKLTPPPELVQQWLGEFFGCTVSGELSDSEKFLATQAARWGADTELEACCELLYRHLPGYEHSSVNYVRAARRPKQPTLKEQALEQLKSIEISFLASHGGHLITDTIRRALEALPND